MKATINLTLFIIFSTFAFSATFWSKMSFEDPVEAYRKMSQDMRTNGIAEDKYMPLICSKIHNDHLKELSVFLTAYQKERHVKNIFVKSWQAMFGKSFTDLQTSYLKVVNSIEDSFRGQTIVDKIKTGDNLYPIETNLLEKGINVRLIQEALQAEGSDDFRSGVMKLVHFDAFDIGVYFSALLYQDSFGCLTVPEISLFIFELFYFKFLKAEQISDFFIGFLQDLVVKQENKNSEGNFKRVLLERFMKFNFQIFIGAENQMVRILYRLFEKEQNKHELRYITDFIKMYKFSLEVMDLVESAQDNSETIFLKNFVHFEKEAWKTFGKKVGVFGLLYTVRLLESTAWGLIDIPRPVSVLICPLLNQPRSTVKGLIEELIDPKEPGLLKEIDLAMTQGKPGMTLKNLDRFVDYFQERMEIYSKCEMCIIYEEDEMVYMEKINKVKTNESPTKASVLLD